MPRPSPDAALLSSVVVEDEAILPGDRPDAPDYFSDDEKEVWVQIVNSYPPHYFTLETRPLLEALIGHTFFIKKIMKEARQPSISKSDFRELSKMFTEHTMAAGNLASKLRLTQVTHINVNTANKFKTKKAETSARVRDTKAWDVIRN